MTKLIQKLGRDRKGATAIEYGLIAAFIALGLVASLPTIKEQLTGKFDEIGTALSTEAE